MPDRITTDSGIPVKTSYDNRDTSASVVRSVGKPGEFPYARGIYPNMYRDRLWTMRQYTGFGSARETNLRLKYLISHGETGLSTAFDLPTQLGLDSDHPRAHGEVGKVGVAISSIDDMRRLFDGIDLGKVSTSMTINSTAPILLCLYAAVGLEQRVPQRQLRGTTQNDILKEYIARNTYIYPPEFSLRLAVDLIEYSARKMPHWHPISISGYHIRESGADAIQELAFCFSNAIEYVEAALARGLKIDDFASQLSFFFACRNDFLEEIAKFRAARKIWANIMRRRFKAQDPESCKLQFHAQTSGETLTAQQPDNNIARVSIQALAAVLGGTQSLHTNSRDEALGLPTEDSVRIALRTQQIIAYESGVSRTADPLGGSYYLESLTRTIETQANALIERVQQLGGARKAIESGFVRRQIQESAYKFQRSVDEGQTVIVGVNQFKEGDRKEVNIQRISPSVERRQIQQLRKFKSRRNKAKVKSAVSRLGSAASGDANLVEDILRAVRSECTVGEISDLFRNTFGEYRIRLEL
ncbi:methylmalonyl-CoA mutase [archaeon 13_1_40CM_2_52_13]|nr:MAG: methylmalonyl-CoA mutase [archaeon 13_1_40CM_2_52_13]TMI39596.1 MAG: methylmalonyl-CoA mutase [Candidatus Bathyarchaeota archaeon]